MLESYKKFLKNYFNFNGCSSRSDYWNVVFINIAISVIVGILSKVVGETISTYIGYAFTAVTLIPGIALCVRRMHDINKSGWNYLFILIPFVGLIMILVDFLTPRVEPNKYGVQI